MFGFICILLSLHYASSSYAININIPVPKRPKRPTISFSHKNNKKKQDFITFLIQLKWGEASSEKGEVQFPSNHHIIVERKKNNLVYKKTISLSEINSINILKWKGTFINKKNKKKQDIEKELYLFHPIEYQINTRDKEIYSYKGRIALFDKILIKSHYGKTVLYSIFYDIWNKRKKIWKHYIDLTKKTAIRSLPHKKSIHTITFFESIKDNEKSKDKAKNQKNKKQKYKSTETQKNYIIDILKNKLMKGSIPNF